MTSPRDERTDDGPGRTDDGSARAGEGPGRRGDASARADDGPGRSGDASARTDDGSAHAGVASRISEIAAGVADGAELNWDELHVSLPELGSLLDHLATLQAITARHRRAMGGAVPLRDEPLPADTATSTGRSRGGENEAYGGHSGPLDAFGVGGDARIGSHAARPREAPARWGPLEIRGRIGEGTFGEVFRAFDPKLQREVALKLARPPHDEASTRDEQGAATEVHLEEARRLARVRHPNVLAIHGVETHEGRIGLWTDLLHGRTLAETFEQEEVLSSADLLRIGIQLCRALQAIHEAGLIHGDVKAANVFSEMNGNVVLMDFGAGRRRRSDGAEGPEPRGSASPAYNDPLERADLEDTVGAGPLFGTPIVLAPEVLEGATPTVSADLYSLGVLLYRAAAGRYPVEASSLVDLVLEHRRGERIALAELRPDLPEAFSRAVERVIARHPAERFESAAQFESSLAIAAIAAGDRPWDSWDSDLPAGVPTLSTHFVGRTRELLEIQSQLDRGACVTLVGVGGSGKTRLAVEVARRFARRYPDGVRWLELIDVPAAAGFLSGVASQLGVRPRPNQSDAEALREHLKTRSTLLILDNAEHVRDAARAWVEEVRRTSPKVAFLITSREALGLGDEVIVGVGPMDLPAEGAPSPGEATADRIARISGSDAVRLFLDRAVLADRSFRPTPARFGSMARLVRRLDGLPLAIELAAARVVSMDVDEICARLERGAALLTEPQRATARHQTMTATLEWSWSLLSAAEQQLLRRLSVFQGGATLVALEHVTADPFLTDESSLVPPPEQLAPREETPRIVLSPSRTCIEDQEVFELLDGLVRKSLVRVEGGRYRLYEVVRHFAAGKLRESGEEPIARRRFLHYFVFLAMEADRRLVGADQERFSALLLEESTNLESALALALRPEHEPAAGLRLVSSLGRYWANRGLFRHGLSHLRAHLDRPGSHDPTAHRADALNWAGILATVLADYPLAMQFHEEGEAVQRTRGFLPGVGTALGGMGDALYRMGEIERARECFEKNVELQRTVGHPIQLSQALSKLAVFCEFQGDLERARTLHEESLALARQRADHGGIATSLTGLGMLHLLLDDPSRALACFTEALAIRRRLDERVMISTTLNNIAHVHIATGRPEEALPYLREALRVQESVQRPVGVRHCLETLSLHAGSCGRPHDGLALLSAAHAIRTAFGEALSERWRKTMEEQAATYRAALSEDAAREAWVSGEVLTLEAAIAFGFSYLDRA